MKHLLQHLLQHLQPFESHRTTARLAPTLGEHPGGRQAAGATAHHQHWLGGILRQGCGVARRFMVHGRSQWIMVESWLINGWWLMVISHGWSCRLKKVNWWLMRHSDSFDHVWYRSLVVKWSRSRLGIGAAAPKDCSQVVNGRSGGDKNDKMMRNWSLDHWFIRQQEGVNMLDHNEEIIRARYIMLMNYYVHGRLRWLFINHCWPNMVHFRWKNNGQHGESPEHPRLASVHTLKTIYIC